MWLMVKPYISKKGWNFYVILLVFEIVLLNLFMGVGSKKRKKEKKKKRKKEPVVLESVVLETVAL